MQLTRLTDYSLRVLMYLAARPDRQGQIEEIATAYNISRGHLMKVVRELAHNGFVDTARGRNGGLQLARPASEIGLGDVVRKTEHNLALVECFGHDPACVIEPACGLHGVLATALEEFFVVLDQYVLSDLVSRPRRMAQLLQIG